MSSLSCPRCGAGNSEFDARCKACGAELPDDSAVGLTRRSGRPAPAGGDGIGPDRLAYPDEPPCIPGYRILGRLGSGGMGTVYLAERGTGGEKVALKTLLRPRAGSLPHFRREILALSRVVHPCIVRILDTGTDNGIPWFAMEHVEGETLRQACDRLSTAARAIGSGGDRPEGSGLHALRPVLTLIRRLCEPLAFLHGEGLVHRDLKPENAVIRRDGWPVLVDFGFAEEFSGSLSREALGIDMGHGGTPRYMAPEQIRGGLVDARADLYSLGCILYELLANRPPFHGATGSEVLRQHLTAKPEPPSRFHNWIPADIDVLVLKLLSKRPRDRFGHASDLAEALEELGADSGGLPGAPPPKAYLYRPEFVGRGELMRTLETRVDALKTNLGGGLALIGGESGVGKTRLIVELARRAVRRNVDVLTGECVPGHSGVDRQTSTRIADDQYRAQGGRQSAVSAPLEPLRGMLRIVADRCREGGEAETRRLLGRRAAILGTFEPALAELPGMDPEPATKAVPTHEARRRLFVALTETFLALAKDSSLLLVLDDLQWADELTLGWLEWLRDAGRSAFAFLVVGTYRSEEVGVGAHEPLQRLLESTDVARFELGRLEESIVGTIAGDMLALDHPPESFVEALARDSEGNPFFVAEYLRAAVGAGILARDQHGGWQVLAGPLTGELSLPSSLRELVGRRLRDLPRDAGTLVDAASIVGRETAVALVAAVTRLEEGEFHAALGELLRRQVLETAPLGAVRFVHDKIREVASESIAPVRRVALHRAVAEAIESGLGGAKDDALPALGHHWEQAGESARARACYLAAAKRARVRYVFRDAEQLYRNCFRLLDDVTSETVLARNELGEVLAVQGYGLEAIEEHARALIESRRIQDRVQEECSLRLAGVRHAQRGEFDAARSCLEQSLAIAREAGWPESEATSLVNLAVVHAESGSPREGRALYEQALGVFRSIGERHAEGAVLLNLAILMHDEGRLDEARALYEQSLQLARETVDRHLEAKALSNLAVLGAEQGRFEEARALLERSLAIKREIADRRGEGVGLSELARLNVRQGRFEEALLLFEKALAIHDQVRNLRESGVVLCEQAGLERRMGHIDKARDLMQRGTSVLRQTEYKYNLAVSVCEQGHLALATGDPARGFLHEAMEFASSLDAGESSELGVSITRLRRAIEACEAGEHQRLVRGELLDDLPEALRQRLAESAQQEPGAHGIWM